MNRIALLLLDSEPDEDGTYAGRLITGTDANEVRHTVDRTTGDQPAEYRNMIDLSPCLDGLDHAVRWKR